VADDKEKTVGGKYILANGVLWAAAIIASAVVGAPTFLSAVLLPALAAASMLVMASQRRRQAS
jgi:hypothetical protein